MGPSRGNRPPLTPSWLSDTPLPWGPTQASRLSSSTRNQIGSYGDTAFCSFKEKEILQDHPHSLICRY